MGIVCTKHILRVLWKIIENVFFLDTKHARIGENPLSPSPQKIHYFYWVGWNNFKWGDSPRLISPKEYPCWFFYKKVLPD